MSGTAKPASKKPATVVLDQLCKEGNAVYLRNVLQKSKGVMGDLVVALKDPIADKAITLSVPRNSIVCASDQVTSEALRGSTDLRRYLREGYLEIMTQDEYDEIAATEPRLIEKSKTELNRMNRTAAGNGNGDQEAPKQVGKGENKKPDAAPDYIRPALAQVISRAQFEDGDEGDLLLDFKALIPFTGIEISHLQSSINTIPDTLRDIRQFIIEM
jgi:hypothetical protein